MGINPRELGKKYPAPKRTAYLRHRTLVIVGPKLIFPLHVCLLTLHNLVETSFKQNYSDRLICKTTRNFFLP